MIFMYVASFESPYCSYGTNKSHMVVFSVVIPTYNRAELLPRSIESVLGQTFNDFELIVVDDGSTDSTKEVVKSYEDNRIVYIKHSENWNGSAARNTGIKNSQGKYIAFLDSDDEWHPEKLELQFSQLQDRPDNWVANYCGTETRRNSKVVKVVSNWLSHDAKYEGQEDIIKGLLTLSGFVHGGSTLAARRSVVESIGGFDESFDRHQDIEFTIRLAKEGKIGYINQDLVTLYESSRPSAETSTKARKRLFETFEQEIKCLEAQGHEIRKYHHFVLARYFLAEGKIRPGWDHLQKSKPANLRQIMGFGLDLFRCVKNIAHRDNR